MKIMTKHIRPQTHGFWLWSAVLFVTVLISMFSQIVEAADATDSSITIYWTSPGDDGNSGTASEYDVRYSTSVINSGNFASATQATGEPSPQIAGSQESFTITGLNPSTLYYIAVKTSDEIPNWSGVSNILSFSTLDEDDPPSAIAALAIIGKTTTSISLNWMAPGADGNSGTATTYDIRYSTSSINAANWGAATQVSGEPQPQIAGSSELYTVTGLSTGTRYYFAIKAADDTPNWSDLSNIASATTDQESIAPGLIANLNVGAITATSIALSWTAPGDDGSTGTATEYDIRYSTSPITAGNWDSATQVNGESSPQIAGSGETHIVTGLNSDTQYYFAIKTGDEVPNWSGISNVSTGTTPDVTPPASITVI